MICSICGKDNAEGGLYCDDCGADLQVKTAVEVSDKEKPLDEGVLLKDKYRIVKVLKDNALRHYLAELKDLPDQKVLIEEKIISVQEDAEESYIKNPLKRQFQYLSGIINLNLQVIYDYFASDNREYLIKEYIEGTSLAEISKKEKNLITSQNVAKWAIAVCDGLAELNSRKLIHRDIQPSSIFLTGEGIIKVSGFKRVASLDNLPSECEVTEGYSPPEAYGIKEKKLDERSDIFSLGATIYHLLSGKAPVLEDRESFFNFPSLKLSSKVSPELEDIVLKAVRKDQDERFQSLLEMKEALLNVKFEEKAPSVFLSFKTGMKTDVGKVRSINQDSCLAIEFVAYEKSTPVEARLYIVADGMGGEAAGDKASSLAIRTVANYVIGEFLQVSRGYETGKLIPPDDIEKRCGEILRNAITEANRIIYEYSLQDASRKGMGSTFTCAIVEEKNLIVGHCGDTRGYLIKEKVEQITEDHSLVGRLVRLGQLTPEEALKSPQRSIIYRALGTSPAIYVDIYCRVLSPGDYFLLCCDGVWEYISNEELLKIFKEVKEPQAIAEKIIETCLERGADDNCTALVVLAEEEKGQVN